MKSLRDGFLLTVLFVLAFGQSLFASEYEILIRSEVMDESVSSIRALSNEASIKMGEDELELKKLSFSTEDELEDFLEAHDLSQEDWEYNQVWRADVSSENIDADLGSFDPLLTQQWSLYNKSTSTSFAGGDIAALDAWGLSEGSGRLYIFDSGIDSNSPEVATRLVGEYNGFSKEDGFGAAFDDNGHGTHVTSVAAGGRNAEGIMGAAPGENVQIVAMKMLDEENSGDTFTAVRAFNWAKDDLEAYLNEDPLHFAVINTSWGGTSYSSELESAMKAVASSRVLFVTSAGNDSKDNDVEGYWPCNFDLPHMICTGASTIKDELANFSSFGKQSVHLMAPGFGILGAVPGIFAGSGTYLANYQDKSGTSQAAPHVAGAALIAWSLNPELSASEIKQILLDSVDIVPGVEDKTLTGGRLNAYRAALMAAGLDPSQADRDFAQLSSGSSGGSCAIVIRGGSHFVALTLGIALVLTLLGGVSSSGSSRTDSRKRFDHYS